MEEISNKKLVLEFLNLQYLSKLSFSDHIKYIEQLKWEANQPNIGTAQQTVRIDSLVSIKKT